jgi:amino acid/peptide:H+ symporter
MTAAGSQRTFLGHPLGLYILFFTEMWERFSYYGMRALLMLYMVNYFKWSQKDASTTYKLYTSLVYVTPILGGYLADRFLGNKIAVVIGALLMAVGHFLMAFEEYPIFLSALIFLILGNGFFKPNMSTQVGRLYPANDGRRDGAYTIFYMGINLGAFLSPLACGWLAENTVGGFHSGFTLAGIGMVTGLAIYLLGQPLIKELPYETGAEEAPSSGRKREDAKSGALSEAAAAQEPSALGFLGAVAPLVLLVLGGAVIAGGIFLWYREIWNVWDAIMLAIGGGCLGLMGLVCGQIRGGARDRVLAILILGFFVVFFWAAYEQAGNVLNIWADQATNRYLTREAKPPEVVPDVIEDSPKKDGDEVAPRATGVVNRFLQIFVNMVTLKPRRSGGPEKSWGETIEAAFNPVPTAWFQSINALAIFLIAPFFAWLWIWLDRRGLQPSIPMKMFLGLVLMSLSMAVMMGAANQENRRTVVPWTSADLPTGVVTTPANQLAHPTKSGEAEVFHAGRLTFDGGRHELVLDGVLDENERDRLIGETAPESFKKLLKDLQVKSQDIDGDKVTSAQVQLNPVPPGFDMKFAGLKESVVQLKDGYLIAHQPLAEKERQGLLVAAGDPRFRTTIHNLFVSSTRFRVSPLWLFWSYILATLGELCLSPVGLSMVSKLAPAKFATMLMGVWMLTSAFGNFAAGALGEIWGTIPPIQFFLLSIVVVSGAALVLLVLVRLVTKMMHGVK